MPCTLSQWFRSKRAGVNALVQLLRHLTNGWEVWRQLKRGSPITRLTLRSGPTIHARPEDSAFGLFWEIFVDRCYLGRDFYHPKPGDTVVDLGANIGVFVLQCQHTTPGVRVHAVEPNPPTFAQLKHNLADNRLEHSVAVYPLAISGNHGSLYLKQGVPVSGHQQLLTSGDGDPIPCITIEGLFAHAGIEHCDLLKIDTEGAELAIVEGASRDIWPLIQRVVLEYHDNIHPGCGERLHHYLTRMGFASQIKPTPGFPHLGMIYARRH